MTGVYTVNKFVSFSGADAYTHHIQFAGAKNLRFEKNEGAS